VVSVNLLLKLEIVQYLNTGKTKAFVDPHHAQTVGFSNAVLIATEEDVQLLKCLVKFSNPGLAENVLRNYYLGAS
jgi:hypothetical protein